MRDFILSALGLGLGLGLTRKQRPSGGASEDDRLTDDGETRLTDDGETRIID